jgi:isocitrate dehydrogenase
MAEKITMGADGKLVVPNNPTIPFIEGDGIGPDIWAAAVRVFDAAIAKAYKGEKKIEWKEVLAGGKAFNQTGSWMPEATMDAFKEYLLSIKGGAEAGTGSICLP